MAGLNLSMYRAVRTVFDPIASVLLQAGVSARPILEALKDSIVAESARRQSKHDKPNRSAIARETGLTRREVSSILDRLHDDNKGVVDSFDSEIGAVVSRWNTSTEFATQQGQIRELTSRELVDLIERLGATNSPQKIIQKMLDDNIIVKAQSDHYEIISRSYNVSKNLPRLIVDTIGTAAATVPVNWQNEGDDGFCQRVSYIPRPNDEVLQRIKMDARRRVSRFVEEADDYLETTSELIDKQNPGETGETKHIGIAAYYFEVDW